MDVALKQDLMAEFHDLQHASEECLQRLATTDIHDPLYTDIVNALFRAVHTIKGNAGMFGLHVIVDFCHEVEEVAGSLRRQSFYITDSIAQTLYIALDRLHDLHEQELLDKHFATLAIDELKHLYGAMADATEDEANGIAEQILQFLGAKISGNDADLFASDEAEDELFFAPTTDIIELAVNGSASDLLFFQQSALLLDAKNEDWFGRSMQLYDWAMKLNHIAGNMIDERQLAAAVYLHDLGMVFIPTEQWSQKLSLDPNNSPELHEHPSWAADYLRRIEGDWQEAAKMVAQHHENLDGTGYPDGLTSQDIHPGAKLLKILDTFFFMTHGSVDASNRSATVRALSAINARVDVEFEGMWVQCFNHLVRSELKAGNI